MWNGIGLRFTSVDKKKFIWGSNQTQSPMNSPIRETFSKNNYAELSWNLFEESAI